METFSDIEAALDLAKVIELVQNEGQHVRISSQKGNAVLLSEESYNNLMVTLEFLATPGLMDSFKKNNEK